MRQGNEKGGEYLSQLEIGTNPCLSIVRDAVYVPCSQKMLTSGKSGTWEAALRIYCPEPETGRKIRELEAGKDFTNRALCSRMSP